MERTEFVFLISLSSSRAALSLDLVRLATFLSNTRWGSPSLHTPHLSPLFSASTWPSTPPTGPWRTSAWTGERLSASGWSQLSNILLQGDGRYRQTGWFGEYCKLLMWSAELPFSSQVIVNLTRAPSPGDHRSVKHLLSQEISIIEILSRSDNFGCAAEGECFSFSIPSLCEHSSSDHNYYAGHLKSF